MGPPWPTSWRRPASTGRGRSGLPGGHAAYVHPDWIAKLPAAAPLLIPHACRPSELIGLLHGAAGPEGQLLIVQACSEPPGRDENGVAATLALPDGPFREMIGRQGMANPRPRVGA
jgi:hypothetical protein